MKGAKKTKNLRKDTSDTRTVKLSRTKTCKFAGVDYQPKDKTKFAGVDYQKHYETDKDNELCDELYNDDDKDYGDYDYDDETDDTYEETSDEEYKDDHYNEEECEEVDEN